MLQWREGISQETSWEVRYWKERKGVWTTATPLRRTGKVFMQSARKTVRKRRYPTTVMDSDDQLKRWAKHFENALTERGTRYPSRRGRSWIVTDQAGERLRESLASKRTKNFRPNGISTNVIKARRHNYRYEILYSFPGKIRCLNRVENGILGQAFQEKWSSWIWELQKNNARIRNRKDRL